MLLSPKAVEKLKDVTVYGWYPYTTHAQRNELIRMFLEEAGRLLDQKAESIVKHAVELYSNGEIPYERYIEMIEQMSEEEATRGATYGEAYARNRVFEFAQTALDRVKEQAYALSLADARKQYEIEKQKAEQVIKDIVQQAVAALEAMTQQHNADLKTITQQQKDELILNQESIIERTKTQIEQILLGHLQVERDRQKKEIQEQEEKRPAREAAHAAIARVVLLEKKGERYKQRKRGLVGLGMLLFLLLVVLLLFFLLPQWGTVVFLVVIASIFATAAFWKSPVSEDKIMENKRQIALYQTESEDYATLSEKERCALLVQRIE